MTQLVVLFNLISALSALIAAFFWYRSSRVSWPNSVTIDGGNAFGGGGMPEVEAWSRHAARENARGALFAAISAIAMAGATLLPQLFGSAQ